MGMYSSGNAETEVNANNAAPDVVLSWPHEIYQASGEQDDEMELNDAYAEQAEYPDDDEGFDYANKVAFDNEAEAALNVS